MMVARKPGHQGERGISRKAIAQEMPGVPVNLWLLPVCTTFCTRDCGCTAHPAFPASLLGIAASLLGSPAPSFAWAMFVHNSGASCRESAKPSPFSFRSDVKHRTRNPVIGARFQVWRFGPSREQPPSFPPKKITMPLTPWKPPWATNGSTFARGNTHALP